MSSPLVVLDVWGGVHSSRHIARYIVDLDDALRLAQHELTGGFLVNLRQELAW